MTVKTARRFSHVSKVQDGRCVQANESPSEDELSEDELQVISEGGARLCSRHHRPAASALSSVTSSAASVATSAGSTAALVKGGAKRPLLGLGVGAQRERNLLLANPRLTPQITPAQKPKGAARAEMTSLVEKTPDHPECVEMSKTTPDRRHMLLPQVLAAISVSLGSMIVGFVSAYTAPALISMKEEPAHRLGNITNQQESWIASLLPLLAIFGGLCGGSAIDRLGRRKTILFMAVPFLLAFLAIAFAQSIWYVYVGRAIAGFCTGIITLALPVYLGETVQSEVRGILGLLPTSVGNFGFLVCFGAGRYLDWSQLALFGAMIPIPFMICMLLIPETPRWYISKDKKKRARKALQWLRGRDTDVSQEFNEIEKNHQESMLEQEPTRCMELLSRRYRKPLFISIGLMLFQQMSGINAVMFYNTDIFKTAKSSLEPQVCSILIGVINLVTVFVSSALIDRLGRKVLLYTSGAIMTVTITVLGIYFRCFENDANSVEGLGWIPMVNFGIYIIGFSIGYGPIPWLMMGEILPAKVRGSAASVATSFNWLTTFLITFTFKHFGSEMGYSKPFLTYGACCFLSIFFVFLFVPETQGKSLEDIERNLTGDGPKVPVRTARRMSSIANLKPTPIAV